METATLAPPHEGAHLLRQRVNLLVDARAAAAPADDAHRILQKLAALVPTRARQPPALNWDEATTFSSQLDTLDGQAAPPVLGAS